MSVPAPAITLLRSFPYLVSRASLSYHKTKPTEASAMVSTAPSSLVEVDLVNTNVEITIDFDLKQQRAEILARWLDWYSKDFSVVGRAGTRGYVFSVGWCRKKQAS